MVSPVAYIVHDDVKVLLVVLVLMHSTSPHEILCSARVGRDHRRY